MGDILRTLPAVRVLRRALPEARLAWILEDRWSGLLDGHPDLQQVVALPRKRWQQLVASPAGWLRLPGEAWRSRRTLRELRLDLALDFHGNLRSGVAALLSGAPVRLGYAGHQQKEGNRWFTTHRVAPGPRRTSRIDRNLELVRALGIPVDHLPRIDLPLADAGASRAAGVCAELGLEPRRYAILAPGASARQAYKTPPPTLLAAAAQQLAARALPALVVYGPGEIELARAVVAAAAGAAILAPSTDLATLAALLREARVFVGGDSGPLHLACAVGCPVLGLYGPTDPVVNSPWGVPFRAIAPSDRSYTGIKRKDRVQGFAGLHPDDVTHGLDELLDELETRSA